VTPEELRNVAEEQRDERRARTLDYHAVFTSAAGQRVLADLKRRNFWGKTTLAAPQPGAPIDGIQCAIHEGRRCVVLDIVKEIELAQSGLYEPGSAKASVQPMGDRHHG
jgi:hypothetical protein